MPRSCSSLGGPPQTYKRGGGRTKCSNPYPPVSFRLSGSRSPTPLSVLGFYQVLLLLLLTGPAHPYPPGQNRLVPQFYDTSYTYRLCVPLPLS
jgi:hypothetical protein